MVNENKNKKRKFESLGLFLVTHPKNATEKKKNKETLALAEKILSICRAEYYQGKCDLKNTTKEKKRFLAYFKEKNRGKVGNRRIRQELWKLVSCPGAFKTLHF